MVVKEFFVVGFLGLDIFGVSEFYIFFIGYVLLLYYLTNEFFF
jgi:hypothetical protein